MYFADIHAKALWLYFPMACSLIANAVLFALTVKEICTMDATLRKLGVDTRDNEMDR